MLPKLRCGGADSVRSILIGATKKENLRRRCSRGLFKSFYTNLLSSTGILKKIKELYESFQLI